MERSLLNRGRLIPLIFLFFMGSFANAGSSVYFKIRKNDQLLKIFALLGYKKFYGHKNIFEKTLKLNPDLKDRNGDLIHPGSKIYFSADIQAQLDSKFSVTADGEIKFGPNRQIAQEVPVVIQPEKEVIPPSRNSDFKLLLGSVYSRLDGHDSSNGSNGKLLSNEQSSLDLRWSVSLSQKLKLYLGWQVLNSEISNSTNKTFLGQSHSLKTTYLGTSYELNPAWKVLLQSGNQERLMYRAINTSTLKIEKIPVSRSEIATQYQFWQKQSIRLSAEFGYRLTGPFRNDFYRIKPGSGYKLELEAEQSLDRFSILAQAFYIQDKISASTVRFTEQTTGLLLGAKCAF